MFIQVLVTFFFWVVARVTEYNFVVAYVNPKKSVLIKLNNDFCNEVRHENYSRLLDIMP